MFSKLVDRLTKGQEHARLLINFITANVGPPKIREASNFNHDATDEMLLHFLGPLYCISPFPRALPDHILIAHVTLHFHVLPNHYSMRTHTRREASRGSHRGHQGHVPLDLRLHTLGPRPPHCQTCGSKPPCCESRMEESTRS